jgi:hypothetical protein
MFDNPMLRDLETVLEYGGPEVTWTVPENAVITPGAGPNMLDGMTISAWTDSGLQSHWSDDA